TIPKYTKGFRLANRTWSRLGKSARAWEWTRFIWLGARLTRRGPALHAGIPSRPGFTTTTITRTRLIRILTGHSGTAVTMAAARSSITTTATITRSLAIPGTIHFSIPIFHHGSLIRRRPSPSPAAGSF